MIYDLLICGQYGGDVYIAISKEDGETEETMGRKLCVLNRIIALLHGPVSHRSVQSVWRKKEGRGLYSITEIWKLCAIWL